MRRVNHEMYYRRGFNFLFGMDVKTRRLSKYSFDAWPATQAHLIIPKGPIAKRDIVLWWAPSITVTRCAPTFSCDAQNFDFPRRAGLQPGRNETIWERL